MKIALINNYPVINSVGGTEKVFCDLANAMVLRGHKVIAVCFDGIEGKPSFDLDPRVEFVDAGWITPPLTHSKPIIELRVLPILAKDKRRATRAKLRSIGNALQLKQVIPDLDVDVFVAFQIQVTHGLRNIFGDKTPIVTMLHGEPNMYHLEHYVSDVQQSTVQILLREYQAEISALCPSANIAVIPNSAPQYTIEAKRINPLILNLGRVCYVKNQELLIRAFHLLKDDFPDWHVEIWGTTLEQKYPQHLRDLILELGLSERVHLMGASKTPTKELLRGSIFAFPSITEGFPLALAEAMSLGLPTVGCQECCAVASLVHHNTTGLLSDNEPAP